MKSCYVAAVSLLFALAAFAQSDRGTITGTLTDSSNAAIAAATVSVTHLETGGQYETQTTTTGNYTLGSLPVGTYTLTVDYPGFKRYNETGISVGIAQTARLDIVLQIGSRAEIVTVSADPLLLKTENAEQSFITTNERIDELPLPPLVVRNPLNWANQVPGVTGNVNGPAGSSTIKVNGSPATTYKVLVDGQDITSSIDPSHTLEQQPSVEAIQEFALESSNFAAEFGQVQGGLFNFTSKSGTNDLHGSAYSYFRNEAFNASTPYTHIRPKLRAYDWGATVGGPVIIPKLYNGRNKTFFFFNWEKYQTVGNASSFITLPTAAMRTGDFSSILGKSLGTDILGRPILQNAIYDPNTARLVNGQVITDPFLNNVIPISRLNPVALKIEALMPMPTLNQQLNNYAQTCSTPDNRKLPSFKIDQNFGTKSKLSFYWSEYDYESFGRNDCLPQPVSVETTRSIPTHTYRLAYDYSVTPTLLIHLGAGFVHYYTNAFPISQVNGYNAASSLGLVGADLPGFPAINFGAATFGGSSVSIGSTNGGAITIADKPTAVASGTLVSGNHTYKAGGEFRIDTWINQTTANTQGNWTFSNNETAMPYLQTANIGGGSIGYGYASFLLGLADSAYVSPPESPQLRKNAWGVYLQDTWKVTRKLTLDYGLRWDLQDPYHEIHNRIGSFGPTVINPSAGDLLGGLTYSGYGPGQCHCQLANTYPYAIGPRLGIAWQIAPKTVLRGGWGLVYGTTPTSSYFSNAIGVGWNNYSISAPTFGTAAGTLTQGLVYPASALVGTLYNPGLYPAAGQISPVPTWIDPTGGGRPPRVSQWNISLQHQITKDIVVEASYVGNRSVWDQANSLIDINALSTQKVASAGLNINSTADQNLLKSTFASGIPQAHGFQTPYAGFPLGQTLAQALRPFPQYGTITSLWADLGNTWYDSLQTKVTQRFNHGLSTTVGFTWSKNEALGAETGAGVGDPVNNVFNRGNQKTISSADQPLYLNIAVTYRTPKIGPNALVKNIAGGWTISGILTYASGLPIAVPASQNNLSQLLFRSTFANRVPGQALYLTNPNCGCVDPNKQLVLNPAAWSDPAPGTWGTSSAYYSDYRSPRTPSESMGFGRVFRLREGLNMEVRAEFQNIFNRVELTSGASTNALATETFNANRVVTGGFGYINATSIAGQRSGQLLARFQF